MTKKTNRKIISVPGGCISYNKGKDKLSDVVTESITEIKDDTVIIDYNKFLSNLIWEANETPTFDEFMDEASKYNKQQQKKEDD